MEYYHTIKINGNKNEKSLFERHRVYERIFKLLKVKKFSYTYLKNILEWQYIM